jgi:uncharacterized RmlC-like cupin family protein
MNQEPLTERTCKVVRSDETYQGVQGLTYRLGLTNATVGSRAICMTFLTLPDGARAKTHLHRGIETAIYVVSGEAETYFGPRLEQRLTTRAGEYLYVPPDMPHQVMNRSGAPCTAVVAHTGPDDQAGIVLLPELDSIVPA